MAIINIQYIRPSKLDRERLWGFHIDLPKGGPQADVYAIQVAGWVIGQGSPVEAIELVYEGIPIRQVPLCILRYDVVTKYPEVAESEKCGFWVTLGTVEIASEFELQIDAVLAEKRRATLGVIRGQQQPLTCGFEPTLQPLMVTNMQRTGTTWLMRLLGEHPQIVAHRVYPYQTRAHLYWMNVLKVLTEPTDAFRRTVGDDLSPQILSIGQHPVYSYHPRDSSSDGARSLNQWLGRVYVEQLAAFCLQSTEAFYQEVARSQGQNNPLYFAEKQLLESVHTRWLVRNLYPKSREIFLFRDFRDMLCSILAFNAKRGYNSFGREKARSDDEYVRMLQVGWLSLLREWKSREAFAHLVRYEDLVTSPVESLKGILEYLDLDASLSNIKDIISRASEEMPQMQEHRTTPDAGMSIGRWSRDLDPSLKALCDEVLGDLQKELGYD